MTEDTNKKKLKFGFSGTSTLFGDIASKLGQWWYITITTIAMAVISICASFYPGAVEHLSETEGWSWDYVLNSVFAVGIIALIFVLWGMRATGLDLENLKSKNKSLKSQCSGLARLRGEKEKLFEDCESLKNLLSKNHEEHVETWLKLTANQFDFNTHVRVSIYYKIGDYFYILARYSSNSDIRQIHRQKFPVNHGVISQTWKHKICVDIEGCPEFKRGAPENYIQYMDDMYGYDAQKVDKLNMKSCQYIGIAITHADNNVGAILFESEKPDFFSKQLTENIQKYCYDSQSYMYEFIQNSIRYNRSARVAETESSNDADKDFLDFLDVGGEHHEQA